MSKPAPDPTSAEERPASGKPEATAAAAAPSKASVGRLKADNIIPVDFGAERTNVSRKMSAREREFLPAALQIIETPVSPTKQLTALALCLLIATAIGWCYFAHIDMVAVAQGKIVPRGQIKVVQPLETSAIRSIYVDDGDHVTAGQLLVDLDPTDVKTDLDSLLYNQGQAALDAEVARLLLTKDRQTRFKVPDNVDPALAEANHSEALNEISKHLAQIAGIDSSIAKQKAILEATQAEIERATATLPLLTEKYQSALSLYKSRDGARTPVLDSDQAVIEKQAELKSAQASVLQTQADIQSLESSRDETTAAYLVDAANQRTAALQKLASLNQEIERDRQREAYRHLTAPVSGTVQNVKIHTPGAVVTAADTLMTIVPDDAGIEVDAQVENSDIGFVHEGQEVEIKLDAFPFTRYGLVTGKVDKLGRDSLDPTNDVPPQLANPTTTSAAQSQDQLTYPATVSLDRTWLMVDGVKKPLLPGMHVSAEIKTGTRRVLEYLLSPVMQAMTEAGRER